MCIYTLGHIDTHIHTDVHVPGALTFILVSMQFYRYERKETSFRPLDDSANTHCGRLHNNCRLGIRL